MKEYSFAVAAIVKDEETNIQRLAQSLKPFIDAGGKVYFMDTGSEDDTIDVGIKAGLIHIEMDRPVFETVSDVYDKEKDLQQYLGGRKSKVFNFSAARNSLNEQVPEEWILIADADDYFTVFDFNAIQTQIEQNAKDGVEYMKYWYKYGENFEFYRSHVFYLRNKFKWEGVCHEYITTVDGTGVKEVYLDPNLITVEHFSGLKETRQKYIHQLAYQYLIDPSKTRSIYYFGRELYIRGQYESAIKILRQYSGKPGGFKDEEAEVMIFIAKCFEEMKQPELAEQAYLGAMSVILNRRTVMSMAQFQHARNEHHKAAAYAAAALELPNQTHWLNDPKHSGGHPYQILYLSRWYTGNIQGAKEAFTKALFLDYENNKHNINYFLNE